jgi:hypothetical protein
MMEKENKKARDAARKEYNETVKVWATPIDRRPIVFIEPDTIGPCNVRA